MYMKTPLGKEESDVQLNMCRKNIKRVGPGSALRTKTFGRTFGKTVFTISVIGMVSVHLILSMFSVAQYFPLFIQPTNSVRLLAENT